jgi:ribosome-binding protein aMBF1 (putative translation factor)
MALKITREREQQGLSMSALAAKAGMHVSSISQIEGGRLNPYPGQVKKLAKALGWKDDPALLFKHVELMEQ